MIRDMAYFEALFNEMLNDPKASVETLEGLKKGREAITKYTTLTKSNSHSLLDVDLITGRNHQIRAHLEYLKTPIVNDVLYSAKASPLLDKDTICLQSYELEFVLFEKEYKFSINEPDYFSSIMKM